jgi:Mg2+/Co2+ transporter CorB
MATIVATIVLITVIIHGNESIYAIVVVILFVIIFIIIVPVRSIAARSVRHSFTIVPILSILVILPVWRGVSVQAPSKLRSLGLEVAIVNESRELPGSFRSWITDGAALRRTAAEPEVCVLLISKRRIEIVVKSLNRLN